MVWCKVQVSQLCSALCDPMDYSLPGSSVHGILQTRILKQVAIPFSKRSSQPRDWTQVSHIAGRLFTWTTREAWCDINIIFKYNGKQDIHGDLLYCSVCFIVMIWNQTHQISEVCLYFSFVNISVLVLYLNLYLV